MAADTTSVFELAASNVSESPSGSVRYAPTATATVSSGPVRRCAGIFPDSSGPRFGAGSTKHAATSNSAAGLR